jgi:hypothetical protein
MLGLVSRPLLLPIFCSSAQRCRSEPRRISVKRIAVNALTHREECRHLHHRASSIRLSAGSTQCATVAYMIRSVFVQSAAGMVLVVD